MFTKYDFFPFRSGFMLLLNFMYTQWLCTTYTRRNTHITNCKWREYQTIDSNGKSKKEERKEKRRRSRILCMDGKNNKANKMQQQTNMVCFESINTCTYIRL